MAAIKTTQVVVLEHDVILGSRYVLQEVEIEEEPLTEEEE